MKSYEIENRIPITPKQKDIIRKIVERSQGQNSWCAVEDLSITKTITKMTDLDRNLRQLERLGLIKRQLDNRSREFVKLKKHPAKEKLYNLYEMND